MELSWGCVVALLGVSAPVPGLARGCSVIFIGELMLRAMASAAVSGWVLAGC